MANPPGVPRSIIRAELRWFASAAALLARTDKEDALLNRFEQLRERVDRINTALSACIEASLDEATMEVINKDYDQIMSYHDDIVQAAAAIKARREGGSSRSCASVGKTEGPGVTGRLPTLQLSRFGGKMEEWVAFKNMFESLVDSRQDLSKAQKMAYLLSTLEDEARSLIHHLRVEDDQYETAWELLNARYQNTRLLADAHAAQLLALPRVTNRAQLRLQLITPVTVACNALRTLGLPVDQWSFLLVHILLGKLPHDVRSRFERETVQRDSTALPTLSDLMKFLEYEARAAESSMQEPSSTGASGRKPVGPSGQGKPRQGPTPSPRGSGARFINAAAAVRDADCPHCGRMGHGLLQCRDWCRLPVDQRRRLAKRLNLCFCCLGSHYARDCQKNKPCGACGGKHHKLLCKDHSGGASPTLRLGSSTGGGAPARSSPPRDEGRGFARSTPLRERGRVPARVSAGRDPSPRLLGQHVADQGPLQAPMGGGLRAEGRGGSPPSATIAAPRGSEPRLYSPPCHEYPRLEYHPPYYRYGRAAGYAPPQMTLCARPPYYPNQWYPHGSERAGSP